MQQNVRGSHLSPFVDLRHCLCVFFIFSQRPSIVLFFFAHSVAVLALAWHAEAGVALVLFQQMIHSPKATLNSKPRHSAASSGPIAIISKFCRLKELLFTAYNFRYLTSAFSTHELKAAARLKTPLKKAQHLSRSMDHKSHGCRCFYTFWSRVGFRFQRMRS
jgi:hypothetical protein